MGRFRQKQELQTLAKVWGLQPPTIIPSPTPPPAHPRLPPLPLPYPHTPVWGSGPQVTFPGIK